MDQTTHSYSSSSSSSSLNNNPSLKQTKPIRRSYTHPLHSVRKHTHKPMIAKQFIAPLPPTPAKVYHVNSANFKQVVRSLTTAREFQSPPVRRLKDIAPPPLNLFTKTEASVFPKPPPSPPSDPLYPHLQPPCSAGGGTVSVAFSSATEFSMFLNEPLHANRFTSPVSDYFGSLSPLGLNLSPALRSDDPSAVALMSPYGLSLSPSTISWCSSVLLSPTSH